MGSDRKDQNWSICPLCQTQLLRASREGNLGRVQDLLAQGLDPNAQDGEGCTTLMEAAGCGQEGVMELLLGLPNINLEVRDQWGSTAFLLAAWGGNLQVVEQLLARGADTAVVNNQGYTMLMVIRAVTNDGQMDTRGDFSCRVLSSIHFPLFHDLSVGDP